MLAEDLGDEDLVDPVLLIPEANLVGDAEGLLGVPVFRTRLLPAPLMMTVPPRTPAPVRSWLFLPWLTHLQASSYHQV